MPLEFTPQPQFIVLSLKLFFSTLCKKHTIMSYAFLERAGLVGVSLASIAR